MRTRRVGWLLVSTAMALIVACGDDDDGDDPGPPAAGSGGDSGSPGESGGEAGASSEGVSGASGASEGGAPGVPNGGQGGEPAVAGAGGQLMEPAEVVIASAQEGPTGIALDDDYVYWANQDAGTIVRCPLTGCGNDDPTELVTDQIGVRGIDVDETSIYWIGIVESDDLARVRKCPLAGCDGEPEVLAEFGAFRPNDVHVDGDLFYYGAWPSFGSCSIDGCVQSGPTHFSAAPAVSVDTDSQYIYVAKHGWGEIHRCELPDCADDTDDILVTDTIPLSVAVDETTLYFAAYDLFEINSAPPPGIFKCPLDGCGTDEPEIVREALSPYAIAVNERRLFYTDVEQGTVTSLAK